LQPPCREKPQLFLILGALVGEVRFCAPNRRADAAKRGSGEQAVWSNGGSGARAAYTRAEAAYPLVLHVAMKCNGDSIAVKISIDNLDHRYALASTRLTPR